ncbi:MAG: biopolymer transporter ExbD [Arenimonas sp.]
MSFSTGSGEGGPMADINVTPLVDVMLVLLIIFMITAPLMTHKVVIKLPEATLSQKPPPLKTPPVTLAIKADGTRFWDDEPLTAALLDQNTAVLVQKDPQPQVNVRADKDAKYGLINDTVQALRRSGVRKVGFVSGPEHGPSK